MMKQFLLTVSLLICVAACSQPGEWTWMDGAIVTNPVAVFGTQGISAPGNHPAGSSAGCRWKDAQGNFWLFGGSGGGGFGAALWKYDVTSNEWTWMKGPIAVNQNANYGTMGLTSPTSYPGSRWLAAHWTDNNGNFWMYGGDGYTSSGNGLLTDLWKYEIATNNWTWMGGTTTTAVNGFYGTQGVAAAGNFPPSTESAACWCDDNNNLWMFGGLTSGARNTLWKYSIATGMWTWMRGASLGSPAPVYGTQTVSSPLNDPGARERMACWKDAHGNFWLFGGQNNFNSQGPHLADLWKYSVSTNEWTWMNGPTTLNYTGVFTSLCDTSGSSQPAGVHVSYCNWIDSCGNLWMFGGSSTINNSNYIHNNLWCYRPLSNSWVYVSGNGSSYGTANYGTMMVSSPQNIPGSSSAGESWIDNSGNLWMYGGNTVHPDVMWRFVPDYSCVGACHEVTSIPDQPIQNAVAVYPLPAQNIVTFSFSGSIQARDITICNSLGQELLHVKTEQTTVEISVQHFPSGAYFYSIAEENGNLIQGKFIVQ